MAASVKICCGLSPVPSHINRFISIRSLWRSRCVRCHLRSTCRELFVLNLYNLTLVIGRSIVDDYILQYQSENVYLIYVY